MVWYKVELGLNDKDTFFDDLDSELGIDMVLVTENRKKFDFFIDCYEDLIERLKEYSETNNSNCDSDSEIVKDYKNLKIVKSNNDDDQQFTQTIIIEDLNKLKDEKEKSLDKQQSDFIERCRKIKEDENFNLTL